MKTEEKELLPGQDPGQWSVNITQSGALTIIFTWDGERVGAFMMEEGQPKFTGDRALSTKAFHQLLHTIQQ